MDKVLFFKVMMGQHIEGSIFSPMKLFYRLFISSSSTCPPYDDFDYSMIYESDGKIL